jgi:hypothetical protein
MRERKSQQPIPALVTNKPMLLQPRPYQGMYQNSSLNSRYPLKFKSTGTLRKNKKIELDL